jgi:cytochrome c-type biogenesis protein CcmH/NrfG
MKNKALFLWVLVVCLVVPASLWAQELFDLPASKVHFEKGIRLYFQQDYTTAIHEFQETLRINPDDVRAYYFLGYAYYKLQDMEKAHQAFEEAYQMNPKYSPIPKTVAQE